MSDKNGGDVLPEQALNKYSKRKRKQQVLAGNIY
jgi:hypothetical protein